MRMTKFVVVVDDVVVVVVVWEDDDPSPSTGPPPPLLLDAFFASFFNSDLDGPVVVMVKNPAVPGEPAKRLGVAFDSKYYESGNN